MAPHDLLTGDPPRLSSYRDGQTLRADDLRADDAERTRAGRRHQALAHTPGVVAGLWPRVVGGSLKVSPGMAVDGAGRSILVGQTLSAVPPGRDAEYEVWVAHVETPGDADAADAPDAPPDRYSEQPRLLFHRSGDHDPARPADHPARAVFLGTMLKPLDQYPETTGVVAVASAETWVLFEGRVYVGVVGGRVEAPAGRARLLLGPEGASDLRQFAVSTRPSPRDPYAEHLALDSAGTLQVSSPCEVTRRTRSTLAVVQVGVRQYAFRPGHVLDPPGLAARLLRGANAVDVFLRNTFLREVDPAREVPNADALVLAARLDAVPDRCGADPRVAAVVCRVLNRALRLARDGRTPDVPARGDGLVLRPETTRLLLEEVAGSPHAEPERLARLVIEDAYAGLLARLPDPGVNDEPRGVTFSGARPAPTGPLPGRIYLATVVEKDRTRRELRVELADPGKENNPERYKVMVAALRPCPNDDTLACPQPVLVIDASRTVTIPGDLKVFDRPDATSADGLILRVRPKADDPNAPPTTQAAGVSGSGLVAPWDLVLRGIDARRDGAGLVVRGELDNTGQGPIVAVQVVAVVFAAGAPNVEPVHETLVRGLEVRPSSPVALGSAEAPAGPVRIALPHDLQDQELTLTLKAIGLAPPTVLTDTERRVIVPKP